MRQAITPFMESLLIAALLLSVGTLHAQKFFEPTNGPQGAALFVGLFPGNDGMLFATENSGGGRIYRSTDNGHTWRLTTRSDMAFGQGRIQSMVARPNGVVLAVYSTFTPGSSTNWQARLYRSASNGDSTSWQWITGLDSVGRVTTLLAGNGTTIVATADSGIYRSTDNGLTWLRVLERQGYAVNGAVSRSGMMYAITFTDTNHGGARAWRSASGANWQQYGNALPILKYKDVSYWQGGVSSPGGEAVVTHAGTLLVPSALPQFQGEGVYRLDSSANPNPQWALSSDGLPPNTQVRKLVVDPDGKIYAGTESDLRRSADNGHTWSAVTGFPFPSSSIVASGSTVLLVNQSNLYRSDDSGASFVLSGEGIYHSGPLAVAVTGSGTLLAGVRDLMFRSTDKGDTWLPMTLQSPKNSIFSDIVVGSDGAILASTQDAFAGAKSGGLIYRSTDDGLTWKSVTIGLVATNIFDIEAGKGLWFAASDSGMYRSTNDGDRWTAVNTGLPTLSMSRVCVAPNGTVLSSTTSDAVWRSTDNGDHWLNANTGSVSQSIRTLLAAPDGTLYMAALLGRVFYRSTNNGASWDDFSSPLPPDSVLNRIFAGAINSQGVIFLSVQTKGTLRNITMRSTDKGASWQTIDSMNFGRVAVFDAADRMYITLGGGGVWRSILPITQALPQLISPSDAATDQPTSVTLRWKSVASALSYQLQIATDSTFASGIFFDQSDISDTFKLVGGLSTKTRYYWRVKAQGNGGSSLWSVEWDFTTNNGAPATVELASPGNGIGNLDTSLLLQWYVVAGATSYRLQVSTDSTFSSVMKLDQVGITDTSYQVIGLERSARYYWRLGGDNAVGSGLWSVVWSFQTAVPASVGSDGTAAGLEFVITAEEVRYWLPRSEQITLMLYDALGQQLRVLVNNEQEAGEHRVILDAGGLASGIYYVLLQSNHRSIVQPIFITR